MSRPLLELPKLPLHRAAAIAFALLVAWVTTAAAVPGPKWDRRVKGLEVKKHGQGEAPARAGAQLYEISVEWWIVCDDEILIPRDLSTNVQLQVNGLPLAETSTPVSIDPVSGLCVDGPSCGGSCGTGGVAGLGVSLICLSDGPGDCKCAMPPIVWRLTDPWLLQPGDQITAILTPAPGAEPETEPLGDVVSVTLDPEGEGIFWNRELQTVTPIPVGPDLWDLEVTGRVQFRGIEPFLNWNGEFPLSFDIVVDNNGVEVARDPVEFVPFPIGATGCNCFEDCGVYAPALETLYCIPNDPQECYCGFASIWIVPSITIEPGDAVEVRFEAAPLAFQENPSWGDDEFQFTCCPFSTDVEVHATPGTETVLAQNRPNPFRSSTTISYRTYAPARITLEIFDVQGRRVRTLLRGEHRTAGTWSVFWDSKDDTGRAVSAGSYFYRLIADGRTQSRKMTMLDVPGTH